MASSWKWKTSVRMRASSSVGLWRSTHTTRELPGAIHAGSTRSTFSVVCPSETKMVIIEKLEGGNWKEEVEHATPYFLVSSFLLL